ncbi:hypothetical protein VTN77DRAFT_2932 [Rasamsonia byssochlamydoides]|uniref:uncharacterized protein n=1 Tax=Rasamsonia byssochlamydoides TaxID=89139 RepID=UPI003743D18B
MERPDWLTRLLRERVASRLTRESDALSVSSQTGIIAPIDTEDGAQIRNTARMLDGYQQDVLARYLQAIETAGQDGTVQGRKNFNTVNCQPNFNLPDHPLVASDDPGPPPLLPRGHRSLLNRDWDIESQSISIISRRPRSPCFSGLMTGGLAETGTATVLAPAYPDRAAVRTIADWFLQLLFCEGGGYDSCLANGQGQLQLEARLRRFRTAHMASEQRRN